MYSDISPVRAVGSNLDVTLPEIGLSKYRNDSLIKDTLNPFVIEKNAVKILLMRERERELTRIETFKKKMLYSDKSNLSRTINQSKKNYMENKKDRSGIIREIN